jgi:23S rRNA (guanosine2251-2'-O)-methyltransferase
VRVVYGANPVRELLRAGAEGLTELWLAEGSRPAADLEAAARAAGAQVRRAPRPKLDRLAGTDRHQGVVAVVEGEFRYAEVEEILGIAQKEEVPPLVLVLDGVEDPQHLGAIARSAVALGAHGLVIAKDRAAGVTPAAIKASAGVLQRCAVARVTNISRIIDEFKEVGIWSTALAADGERSVAELDLAGPTALVLGNEGEGVRPLVRRTCDQVARIEMTRGVESLSVAAAAAVVLYEAARQRRGTRR